MHRQPPTARRRGPLLVGALLFALTLPALPANASANGTSAQPGKAAGRHRVAVAAGGGVWMLPERGFHGIAKVAWDWDHATPGGGHLAVVLDTNQLSLVFDRLPVAGRWLTTGLHASGELLLAGLLSDYYRHGLLDSRRSFKASTVDFGAHLKALLPGRNAIELRFSATRWFFGAQGDTHPSFILPPDLWMLRPQLYLTHWALRPDPSLGERHRPFPRVRGVVVSVFFGLDIRPDDSAWGARSTLSFDPPDLRNTPDKVGVALRQSLRAGWQLHSRVRTQVAQHLGYGHGLDDLNRARLGGLNPYNVSLAGAPWAHFVAENYLAVQWSWHFRIWRQLELGILVDGLLLTDPDRAGVDTDLGLHAGLGLFADFYLGPYQLDLRLGWSPTLVPGDPAGGLAAYLNFGWQWDSTSRR